MSNPQLRTALQSVWSNRKYVARIGGYLAPYRVKVALAIIVGAGSAVLGLAPALVLRAVVNNLVHGRHSVGQAAALVSLGVLALILAGLLGVAESYLVLTVGKRVSADAPPATFRPPAGAVGRLLHQKPNRRTHVASAQ